MNAVLLMSRLIWQMLVVILANSAIQWLNPLIYNRLIYSYSESLRERVMMKIHAMPLSYLDRQGTGDMVSRVTTDSDQLNNGLLMVFNQFFVGLLTIFVIIITMARLDWFMMLLVLVMRLCQCLWHVLSQRRAINSIAIKPNGEACRLS